MSEAHSNRAALQGTVAGELDRWLDASPAVGLSLIATPIGNLGDITLRALAALATADVIYAEDTRRTLTLLNHYAIRRPVRSHHEHSSATEFAAVLADLEAGKAVALVTDAGMPLISDPGFPLVREAIAKGHRVTVLPGPSAVLAALAVGGLPADTFLFAGFLPPRTAGRRAAL
ncbi:MAG TPA: SAM-dependent methyltransferase, partial [Hyphomicrobiaceae bacterium]|nr:SAM-dependent methyltransferase [Hyphomicrobiaceae bacterium]